MQALSVSRTHAFFFFFLFTNLAVRSKEETGVHLNTVDNPKALSKAIKHGEWDTVLREVNSIELADDIQFTLFEHIALEMVDDGEVDVAHKMMRATRALKELRERQPGRYQRLEAVVKRGKVLEGDWPHGSRKKGRKVAAKEVSSDVIVVPPSRLLTMVGQALKWQRHMGLLPAGVAFSLFRDKPPAVTRENERIPVLAMPPLVYSKGCRPLCCAFSPDGQSVATGSSDGFVEIWNWLRAALRTDLAYQAKDELLMHESDVLCLGWSKDSELLVSGDVKGTVKVWQVSTGKCLRRFKAVHEKGVTSVSFSSDSSKVLTSSLDGTVRLHGLVSGKTLKVLRGHSSYVHRCFYVGSHIASCSTDGTIRLWDKKSGELHSSHVLTEVEGKPLKGATAVAVVSMVCGRDKECVIACTRSGTIVRMGLKGELLMKYSSSSEVEFTTLGVSSLGRYVYGGTSAGQLFVFDYDTGSECMNIPLHEKELTGLGVHPHQNALCSLSFDNRANLWKTEEI